MSKNVDTFSPLISKVEIKRLVDELFERSLMPHQVSPTGRTYPERKLAGEGYQHALKDIENALGLARKREF